MTQRIELFYDFRSPYSYLAFTQLCEMDVDIALRPMNILKVMEKVGTAGAEPAEDTDFHPDEGEIRK